MVMMAGYDLPLRAIRQQIAAALDLILHLERMHDGSRKIVAITEVQRMESDVITLQDLFAFHVDAAASGRTVVGTLVSSGLRPTFLEKFERRGVKLPGWLAVPALPNGRPPAARGKYT
jgi:pilus assembly protein CpaF